MLNKVKRLLFKLWYMNRDYELSLLVKRVEKAIERRITLYNLIPEGERFSIIRSEKDALVSSMREIHTLTEKFYRAVGYGNHTV